MDKNSVETLSKEKEKEVMEKEDYVIDDLDYVKVKLSKVKFAITYASLLLSLVMASLDLSIISTALPKISSQFHAYESFTWIITAYMLTNTAIQPTFGKFADIFGRKFMIVFTLVLFIISSFICGIAPNIGVLIVGRAIQGIGGGGITVLINVIIADITPLRKRGLYMGINGAIFTFSSVVGPLIGGFFTDKISWRWSFYINVPIGIACLILIIVCFKFPTEKRSLLEKIKRIDFSGTFTVIISLVLLLLALNWGGQKYPWRSTIIILLLSIGTFLLIVYIIIECKFAKEPITPPSLFKYRNVTAPCLASFFNGAAFLTTVNTLPLLYQDGRHFSATISGLRMTPASFCISISAIGSGYLIGKWGHIDKYIKTGSFLMIFSSFFITLIGNNTSYLIEFIIFVFFGFTVGLIFQNCIMVAQQVSPPEYLAISTTLISFFNTIGAVVGVALHSALLQSIYQKSYKSYFPDSQPITINDIHNIENGDIIYVEAMQKTYRYTIVPASIIVFLCAVFIKNFKLSSNKNSEAVTIKVDDQNSTETLTIDNH